MESKSPARTVIHLVCNAHLDPVWQWGEAEGIGAALATFRCAADLCEEFGPAGFVFNHNEALLYRWVEEYEPPLFERIQKLVAAGSWVIIGGFELQPDCVMPGAESYIRQILRGRRYFQSRFGARPTVAVNFDSFGHSRGLVQLLAKSGYRAYIFMRPGASDAGQPTDFVWTGFDGSQVMAHRLAKGYNTLLGDNGRALDAWLAGRALREAELYPWGVGNHGGGPSREDILAIEAMRQSDAHPGIELRDSNPEAYFDALEALYAGDARKKARVDKSLYSANVGCYTSMAEIKQGHRALENALLRAEKMALAALLACGSAYPKAELDKAWQALAFLQFHDVLPGSHTQPVMEAMLHRLGYGMEIAGRAATQAFFALAAAQPKARENTVPVLVFNPHPYTVRHAVECEYMLQNQNWDESTATVAAVTRNGRPVPAQMAREDSNLPLDWRKKVLIQAELEPFSITRFDCEMQVVGSGGENLPQELGWRQDGFEFEVDAQTGRVKRFCCGGAEYAGDGFGGVWVYEDDEDPWHMRGEIIGKNGRALDRDLAVPVRVTEDGPVARSIEAQFAGQDIRAVVRYTVLKALREVRCDVRLTNALPDKIVKLCFAGPDRNARLLCETMGGVEEGFADGTEAVSQKFACIEAEAGLLGIVGNGVYGGSFRDGAYLQNLLRSPAYCAHPIEDRPILPPNRHTPRMGIGCYAYSFALLPLGGRQDLPFLARRAQVLGEAPYAVSYFPPGAKNRSAPQGAALEPELELEPEPKLALEPELEQEGDAVLLAAKPAETGEGVVLRLSEPGGRQCAFALRFMGATLAGTLQAFEIRTLLFRNGAFENCNIIEET
jgi:alpha-mannosidase